MKLIIVNGDGRQLGEVKLSQELLRRSDMLVERVASVIRRSVQHEKQGVHSNVVEESPKGMLQRMDEDGSVLDIPLSLNEACSFDFQKHSDAIVSDEQRARDASLRFRTENEQTTRRRRAEDRYREKPGNRIRFK